MDQRAKLSIGLVVVAFGVGAVVASGVGADPAPKTGPAAPRPRGPATLAETASPAELKLWNERGCVTCHGADGRGTNMGPDVVKLVPVYLAKHGSPEAARKAIAAYLVDPAGSEKLRDDGVHFSNPMPAIEKMVGGRREDADVVAGLLIRLGE
jgi:mono/diheme cytochrome c family protein